MLNLTHAFNFCHKSPRPAQLGCGQHRLRCPGRRRPRPARGEIEGGRRGVSPREKITSCRREKIVLRRAAGTAVAWWCGHAAGGISPRRGGKGEIRLLGFCRGLSETGEVLAGVWEGGDGQQGEVAAQGGEGCRGLGVSSDPMEEVSRSSGGGLRKPGGGAAAVRLGDGG